MSLEISSKGMMDQKMIQMFIDEQKRKLEERDRLLMEKR